MKISILVPDLSCKYGNCISRAYLFAKILQKQHTVEIVGLSMESDIWKPVAQDRNMVFKQVPVGITSKKQIFSMIPRINSLIKQIDGDVIYASKPLLMTLGVALYSRLYDYKPLMVDLDDWQMGIRAEKLKAMSNSQRRKELFNSAFEVYKTYSYWNNYLGEKLINYADVITVSNNFLQNKFGGNVIRHAVDTDFFNSEKYSQSSLREKHGILPNQKVLMFCGSLEVEKGIEDLVEAVNRLSHRDDILLAIVGNNQGWTSEQLLKAAREKIGNRLRSFGLQPFEKIPEFLAMSDLIVIPQRNTLATVGQIPIKLFEGMAMSKPVLSTKVSDISEILESCGTVVEPGNPEQLAEAIEYLLNHPETCNHLAQQARLKCVENYSWDAVGNELDQLINQVVKSKR